MIRVDDIGTCFYQPFWQSVFLDAFSGVGSFELPSSLTHLTKNIVNAPTIGGMPANRKGRS